MTSEVGYFAAFAGGFLSFASPCVLPLVPVYISLIGGTTMSDLSGGTGKVRARIVRDSALFVAGFSAVFIALGLSITTIGGIMFENQNELTRVSGAIVVLMALFLLLSQSLSTVWLQAERRFRPELSRFGPFAAPVAGAAFGFGWTPCLGPVLASVLAVAATQGETARGGLLLTAYALGLGIPFLLTGIAFGKLTGAFSWLRRNGRSINLVAAILLLIFGLLLLLDRFTLVTSKLQSFLQLIGLDSLITIG